MTLQQMSNEISLVTLAKNIGYIPALFVGISMENYALLAILLVVDVITGIWRSAVVEGGE